MNEEKKEELIPLADFTVKEAIALFKKALEDYKKEYNEIRSLTNIARPKSFTDRFRNGLCKYFGFAGVDSYGRIPNTGYGLMDIIWTLNVLNRNFESRILIDDFGYLDLRINTLEDLIIKINSFDDEKTIREVIDSVAERRFQ